MAWYLILLKTVSQQLQSVFVQKHRSCKSVRLAVSRSVVHFPCQVTPKDYKKCYQQLSCFVLNPKRIVRITCWQVRLLCPWARHLTDHLDLFAVNRRYSKTAAHHSYPGCINKGRHSCQRRPRERNRTLTVISAVGFGKWKPSYTSKFQSSESNIGL